MHPWHWQERTPGFPTGRRQKGIPGLQSPLGSAATYNILTISLKGKIMFLYLNIGKSTDVQES